MVADNYLEGYHIPIAHPGLMRMLDYKHYDVEVHEHCVWFEAPMRNKPSSNRLERLYAQLATPMPGLDEEDLRVWRYVFIYPNTTIDLYPDQVNTWQMVPDGVGAHARRVRRATGRPGADPRTRAAQWLNQKLNKLVLDEDIDLVDNVQQGLQTRGYRCGPLSRREERGGVVRRPRACRPGSGDRRGEHRGMSAGSRRSARERILAAAVRQIAVEGIDGVRIARIAMDAGVSTSLVHYHFDTRDALLAEALDYSYAHAGEARISSRRAAGQLACRAAAVDDRPVPAALGGAARGLGAVGRAVAARGAPSGAAPGRRGAVRAAARVVRRRDRRRASHSGEFARCDPDEVADRALALIDGYGIRTLIGDSAIPLERARARSASALARDLGLGECSDLRPRAGCPAPTRAAARPVRTAPSM